MKPAHVEVIVAIADAGSLRAAAELIGKTQPALTKALRQAEDGLGARIFTRAARGIEPTEIGRAVIARARVNQAEFRKLEEEVGQIMGDRSGQLSVTVSPLAALRIIPQALNRFRRRFPRVHVQVSGGHPPSTIAQLRSGQTDIVFGPLPDPDYRSGIHVRPLFASPISIITGENSRFLNARRLSELQSADWFRIGPRERIFGVGHDFQAMGLTPPKPAVTSDSITSLLAMLEWGDRLCSFPTMSLPEILPRWKLRVLDIEDKLTPVEIGLMVRADRPLTPAGLAFVEAAVAQAQILSESLTDNQRL
ncbi:LysR family transcriptional regulator [Maritimibacter sp. DP1N21-5]|uniref:LysR family transcriptional regulator n=1 Tax=Maritimibacter sp. DP1N21-5 TaxID=2836867 RepID=UPI001C443B6E|nr:LysR family transcriptional regulator [Maritimibacter sp. DP1N21-5]